MSARPPRTIFPNSLVWLFTVVSLHFSCHFVHVTKKHTVPVFSQFQMMAPIASCAILINSLACCWSWFQQFEQWGERGICSWICLAIQGQTMLLPITQANSKESARRDVFYLWCFKVGSYFDELVKNGNIMLSHAIPPLEELKQHLYCKWHNSTSHAINDCNIFCRQVQSSINEPRLVLSEMQIDKVLSSINEIDLNNTNVFIQLEQAEGTNGKNRAKAKGCQW